MSSDKTPFIEAKLLQALGTRRAKNDKRLATRTEARIAVQIRCKGHKEIGPWEKAQLRDISARGCSIAVQDELAPGESFIIQLPGAKGITPPAPLIARVVHCKQQGGAGSDNGAFVIGAEFSGRVTTTPKREPAQDQAELERIRRSILL